ncbi:uncharacterized protein LOC120166218 [Hibiscus syriacus]|uniref:uncharacterized protein LOC120166218 n=1 Tax=Hibiscus syriacus TaxID=106335 RepID=UPI001921F047|nr:uncharacterized protein LOC120166218 [Hibiscus syriacus]
MEAFRSTLLDCDLSDLGSIGRWYTLERGRLSINNVHQRLDRGVANPSWWDLFLNYSVEHLTHISSDHCPVLVSTTAGYSNRSTFSSFCFDANWVLETECKDLLSPSKWSSSSKARRTATTWGLKEKLTRLLDSDPDDETLVELLDVRLALNLEANKDELYWEQRAHVNWLHHGDRNIIFPHKWATYRKKKNKVLKLLDINGNWLFDEDLIATNATVYFSNFSLI